MSLAFGSSSPSLFEQVQVHTPTGAPVRIELAFGWMAVMAVIDTGAGVNPVQAAQLF